jgi:cell division protein FtsX
MVMRSDERRETAGILRLIGLSRPRILLEGFFEGLCIALAGAAFGVAVALAVQGAFNRFFQWYYDTALVFVAIGPGTIARCLLLAVPLGVLAGLVASWTLLRREILALLRR